MERLTQKFPISELMIANWSKIKIPNKSITKCKVIHIRDDGQIRRKHQLFQPNKGEKMYEFVKTEGGWQVCWGLVPGAGAKNTENGERLAETKDAESSSEQILLRRLAGRCAARRAASTHKRRDLILN